jgi:polysaccharide biosynthesis transport protein
MQTHPLARRAPAGAALPPEPCRPATPLTAGHLLLATAGAASALSLAPASAPAALAGAIAGLLVAIVLDAASRRRRAPAAETERPLHAPVLGRLPDSARLAIARELDALAPAESEACRRLLMNLRYRDGERDTVTVAVTAAARGDGTSTIAWVLAATAARAGIRTLLVEADLEGDLADHVPPPRRTTLNELLSELQGGEPQVPEDRAGDLDPLGLTDVLAGESPFDVAAAAANVGANPCFPHRQARVDVLYAGTRRSCPELLSGSRLADLLADAEERYEMIVVDAPPVAHAAHAVPVVASAGAVLIVTRPGHTPAAEVVRLSEQLALVGVHVTGTVVNGDTTPAPVAPPEPPQRRGRLRPDRPSRPVERPSRSRS